MLTSLCRPQGGRHTVVRWVHRSSFTIRAAPGSKSIRLPMPSTAGAGPSPTGAWVVDPDWYGTVVLETEGTTEGHDDLQARCRSAAGRRAPETDAERDRRMVWRILRERRCVTSTDDTLLVVSPLFCCAAGLARYGSGR